MSTRVFWLTTTILAGLILATSPLAVGTLVAGEAGLAASLNDWWGPTPTPLPSPTATPTPRLTATPTPDPLAGVPTVTPPPGHSGLLLPTLPEPVLDRMPPSPTVTPRLRQE